MQIKHCHCRPLFVALPFLLASAPSMSDQSWSGMVGARAIYAPDYLGSNDYETRAWPAVNLSYGDRFYLSARRGVGWNVIRQGHWRVSPFIGYHQGRDSDGDLRRLDKVDSGATAGLRVAYTNAGWTYTADAKAPFTDDMDGYQISLKTRWQGRLSERWSASLGPDLTYSSADWTKGMFGISSNESMRSGLSLYDPDNGYLRVGLSGSLTYWLTPEWSITGVTGVSQLTGDAKDSPIVDDTGDASQVFWGGVASYKF